MAVINLDPKIMKDFHDWLKINHNNTGVTMNEDERATMHAMTRIREILQMQDAELDMVVRAVELLDDHADLAMRRQYNDR